ncbi:MAG: DALR domain-containing protein, partial [Spirochaetota bacterium]
GVLSDTVASLADECIRSFTNAMDNDLNVAQGVASLFDFVTGINRYAGANTLNSADAERIMKVLGDIDSVFGFIFMAEEKKMKISEEKIEALIRERTEARDNRDFARSDEIRDYLLERGVILEDSREGTRWKPA